MYTGWYALPAMKRFHGGGFPRPAIFHGTRVGCYACTYPIHIYIHTLTCVCADADAGDKCRYVTTTAPLKAGIRVYASIRYVQGKGRD